MIQVEKLRYTYPGSSLPAVRDISFSIDAGEIFGFLGPSGAGKSTTQKLLIGLLSGYTGSVRILERELKTVKRDYYEKIGVAFEFPNFYSKLSAKENLDFFSSLYRGSKTIQYQPLLDRLGLGPDRDKKLSNYSKGMKMRLNFCRALMHDPSILFLDEPTAGLDPVNARILKDMVLEEKNKGKAVFLTTHDMHLAEELCDTLAFIDNGSLVLMDKPRNLKLKYGKNTVYLEYLEDGKAGSGYFDLTDLGRNKTFLSLLQRVELRTIHSQEASLESIFIQSTGRTLS